MTATICFVRHASHGLLGGVLCGRMEGVGLSEQGAAEARLTAEAAAALKPSALYVSPIQRARETAVPLAEATGLEPVLEPALNEIDFGRWTGKAFSDLAADPDWSNWNRARDQHRPPGGESMLEAQARVAGWMDAVWRTHTGQTVVAVSHCDLIKAAVAHALGLPLDHYDRFEISPGSLTTLLAGGWGAKLHSLNKEPT